MAPLGDVTVRRALLVGVLVVSGGFLAATRFWPTVQRIEIVGAGHHAPVAIAELARVSHGDPLLWITRWRAAGLARDPWIAAARVTRHWPDTVSIAVWERTPSARGGTDADAVVWADDGTPLPGVPLGERGSLPIVRGWGVDRTAEAMELLNLLSERNPKVVEYSPVGFEIVLANVVILTPDRTSLERQWAAVERVRTGRLAIYPWGVSVADD